MQPLEPSGIKIIVAIEELKTQDFITLILLGEGYDVKSYTTNVDVLAHLEREPVDLVISDFQSTSINGLTLSKKVRGISLFRHIPLILLIPQDELLMKTKAIYAGADDFVTKPFSSEEIIARIIASLLRTRRYQDVNPVTKLPGISTAIRELKNNIESLEQFGVALADLNNFKIYNDRYGYKRGDEIIAHTSGLIRNALTSSKNHLNFLSHLGGDDFLLISSCEHIETVCQNVVDTFQKTIVSFYDETERVQGHILLTDGKGSTFEAPLLRIHLGVVTNEDYPFFSSAQVLQIATELKNHAKISGKSAYSKERRHSYPFY